MRGICIVFLLAFALVLVACDSNQPEAPSEIPLETPPETPPETHREFQIYSNLPVSTVSFPPDYSRAESIHITVVSGGTTTGAVYAAKRADESMMWSREEFNNMNYLANPRIFLLNPTFESPDEYLFDTLIEAMFSNRTFTPTSTGYNDDWAHENVIIYDGEGAEIVNFYIFYPGSDNYIRWDGYFYHVSHLIDWEPFLVARILYMHNNRG